MTGEQQLVTGAVKCCPHCAVELTADDIKRLWSNYTTSLRQTLGGPKKLKKHCQSCGMLCNSARGAWSHCRIPRGLDAAALFEHVLGRIPAELEDLEVLLGRGRPRSLEGLKSVLAGAREILLSPAQKRQAKWYAGYIERALNKLEDAA